MRTNSEEFTMTKGLGDFPYQQFLQIFPNGNFVKNYLWTSIGSACCFVPICPKEDCGL